MSKLYPPQLEGTLPSFCKTSNVGIVLTIPFSMNRAVDVTKIKGFVLKVKDVINNESLFTIETHDFTSTSEAKFTVSTTNLQKLTIGSYYKFQLAYLDNTYTAGYFSTVGVTKCTAKPTINIQNLELLSTNNHRYSYVGYYSNAEDPTEKVYSYRFIITDNQSQVVKDSGEQIHNVNNNSTNTYESTDTFYYNYDLEENKTYQIQYIITTNNGLIVKTPKYRLKQSVGDEITEPVKLETIPNFDEGCVNIILSYDGEDSDLYQLDEIGEFNDILTYYELQYNQINLTTDQYTKNKYYISTSTGYQLCDSDNFDIMETYYSKQYQKIDLTEELYLSNQYYLRIEHYARGNFLLTRSSKDTNYLEWDPVAQIKLDGYGKEFYNSNDYTVEQGKYYKYALQQYNSYGVLSKKVLCDEIFVDFEDLFLYDGEKQLKVKYNPKVSSFKLDILENKVDTIGGQYPYIFRNGSVKYHEFPISGLVSYKMDENYNFITEQELGFDTNYRNIYRQDTAKIDEIKNQILENLYTINRNSSILNSTDAEGTTARERYTTNKLEQLRTEINNLTAENINLKLLLTKIINNKNIVESNLYPTTNLTGVNISAERTFKLKVLEWLTNGKPKLFRSPGEGNYIVNLMNVSMTPQDGVGRMLHDFSATAYEIADCTYESLISDEIDLVHVDTIDYNFLLWKTIRLSQPYGQVSSDDNSVFYLNSNNEAVKIYDGTIEYTVNEILNNHKAYSILFNEMTPGSVIYLNGTESENAIVIGATGSYYTESEEGFDSIYIPSEALYNGIITYSYYGRTKDRFDLLSNEQTAGVGIKQFIGDATLSEDVLSGTNIINKINNAICTIFDFGYIQILPRDIIEVEFYDWEKTYYKNSDYEQEVIAISQSENNEANDIYYYIDETQALDARLVQHPQYATLEENTIYYINNQYFLNGKLAVKNLDNYKQYIQYEEIFQINDTIINTNNNSIALYKYQTNKILSEDKKSIINLSTSVTVYKDCYNNKYYIDNNTYNILIENDYEDILSYFDLLNFDAQIDSSIISLNNYSHLQDKGLLCTSKQEFNENLIYYSDVNCINLLELTATTFDPLNTYYNPVYKNYISNYDKQFKLKDIINFDKIILGNGLILNTSYQTINKTYAFEDIENENDENFDLKLQELKKYLLYYENQMNHYSEDDEFINLIMDDLDGIIEYYKDKILNEVLDDVANAETLTTAVDSAKKYSDFLLIYNAYLDGQITSLADLASRMNNLNIDNTIQNLITEMIIVTNNAREQYTKYYELYVERIAELLELYEQESDINE